MLDFWYGDTLKDIARISCSFSDIDCVYRGNMYNKEGKMIGDFSFNDSLEIEKIFNVSFD